MEHHETLSLINELQTLCEEFRQIACFIRELKRDYSVLEEKIELSSADVLHLLGISKASLARWRESNSIPYRYVSSNHVVYPFKGLYLSVKTGRATFKGFRRLEISYSSLVEIKMYYLYLPMVLMLFVSIVRWQRFLRILSKGYSFVFDI